MEEDKWRYLRDLFSRNPESNFQNCLKEIKKLEANARRCYSEDLSHIGSNEFVEMMVLDGCFILEYFLKHLQEVHKDPIFTMIWMPPIIDHDLYLVENQLPFFILSHLFDLVIKDHVIKHVDSITISSFQELLIKVFFEWNENNLEKIPPKEEIHHLLHLKHMGICPIVKFENSKTNPQNSLVESRFKKLKNLFPSFLSHPFSTCHESSSENQSRQTIPSATELQQAGVSFKKTDSRSFLDIKFRQGVMEIPSFYIYDGSESRFRNLITLEQWGIPNSEITYVTSYAFFMDSIINTSEDIVILQQNGIIEHLLGSNEEVAILFNRLCKDVTLNLRNHYLSDVFKDVNRYYQTSWHKWRASLMRDYFSNPWAIFSLLAAIFLLGLTTAQTFFSVYAYFRPP